MKPETRNQKRYFRPDGASRFTNDASRAPVGDADRSQYMYRCSVAISNNLTSPDTPVDAPVRPQDAMFKRHIGALRLHRVAHGEYHMLTIIWVDEREQRVLRATGRSRR